MNPFRTTRAAFALALSGALLTAGLAPMGCNNAERTRQDARASAQTFRQTLERLPNNIDATLRELAQLTAADNTRRADTFRNFSQEFSMMQDRAQQLSRQADLAETQTQTFFREYVRESMASRDPAAREAAVESLANRRDAVDNAQRLLSDGRRQYRDFAGTLRDIQNRLRTDLSPEAINRLSPQISAAIREGTDVRNYIDRLDEQIDAILNIQR